MGMADGDFWVGLDGSIIQKLSGDYPEIEAGRPGLARVVWVGPIWLAWAGPHCARFLMKGWSNKKTIVCFFKNTCI